MRDVTLLTIRDLAVSVTLLFLVDDFETSVVTANSVCIVTEDVRSSVTPNVMRDVTLLTIRDVALSVTLLFFAIDSNLDDENVGILEDAAISTVDCVILIPESVMTGVRMLVLLL